MRLQECTLDLYSNQDFSLEDQGNRKPNRIYPLKYCIPLLNSYANQSME